MGGCSDEGRGLAHGVVGPARVVVSGVCGAAPAGSVAGGQLILVAYAGFASALVALVVAVFGAAIWILFAMGREWARPALQARLPARHTPVVAIGCAAALALVLGLPLTDTDGGPRAFGYLAGAGALSVVPICLAVTVATVRASGTEFRDQFRLWRHLLVPAAATVLFLLPLWAIIHPRAYMLASLLPFAAVGWLCLGVIAAGVLRARRPTGLQALVRCPGQPKDSCCGE